MPPSNYALDLNLSSTNGKFSLANDFIFQSIRTHNIYNNYLMLFSLQQIATPTTASIASVTNISSILPNASIVDSLAEPKFSGSSDLGNAKFSAVSGSSLYQTSSPLAPSEVSPNTAICDRPKVKSVSKKDSKNNRKAVAAANASMSSIQPNPIVSFC